MEFLFILFLSVASAASAQTLRQQADRAGILVSVAAVRPAQLNEVAYASTLAREFNMLEPENDLKWAVLGPDEKTFDFKADHSDQLSAFTQRSALSPCHPKRRCGRGHAPTRVEGSAFGCRTARLHLVLYHSR